MRKIEKDIVNAIYDTVRTIEFQNDNIGDVYLVNIDKFDVRDAHLEILELFTKGFTYTLLCCWKTKYYKIKRQKRLKNSLLSQKWQKVGGHWMAIKRIVTYYRLYNDIKKKGFRIFPRDSKNYPLLFLAEDYRHAMHGAHRYSIGRNFGYQKIPAIVITPKDISGIPHIEKKISEILKKRGKGHLQKWVIEYLQGLKSPNLKKLKQVNFKNRYYRE